MKDWMKDALSGAISGWLGAGLIFPIIMEGFLCFECLVVPQFFLFGAIGGLIGGLLGGRFLKFRFGNVLGGVVLGVVAIFIIAFF